MFSTHKNWSLATCSVVRVSGIFRQKVYQNPFQSFLQNKDDFEKREQVFPSQTFPRKSGQRGGGGREGFADLKPRAQHMKNLNFWRREDFLDLDAS